MKTQGLFAQSVSTFAASKAEAATKQVSKTSDGGAFSGVMERNMQKDSRPEAAVTPKEQNVAGTKVNSQKQVAGKEGEEPAMEESQEGKSVVNVQENQTVQEVTTPEEAIKEVVKEVTGLSEEELAEFLGQYQITPVDLLDPAKLQQFVIALHGGEDVSLMLTDETAAAEFSSLLEEIQNLQEDFPQMFTTGEGNDEGILAEDFREQLAEQLAEPVSLGQDGETGSKRQVESSQKETTEDTSTIQTGPSIMVEKEENSSFTGEEQKGQEEMADSLEELQAELPETHTIREAPVNIFAQNLANAAQSASTGEVAMASSVTQMMDIVNQVVEQIKISLKEDVSSMDMMLHPESLGRLQLTVEAKAGVMTANFIVQSEVAKEAIESQMQVLQEQLEEKNIKVEAVEVSVSDFDFEGSTMAQGEAEKQGSRQSSSRRRELNLEELEEGTEELTEEETLAVEVMKQTGSSIDYTA